MQTTDPILYTVDKGVATLTLHRPDKMNAITHEMFDLYLARVAEASADPAVRVIIITGSGRGFCAGIDLGFMSRASEQQGIAASAIAESLRPVPTAAQAGWPAPQWDDSVGPALQKAFGEGWGGLITSRKPTIAAINGPAFGWGLILALLCDVRFAARSAIMNGTFARLGVPGEKGVAWLLSRLIGTARAADLLYTARSIDATEAERLGMVNEVVDDAELATRVATYAAGIAANAAPRSLAAIKAQIWTAQDDCYANAFTEADQEQERCMHTQDFVEAMTSYMQKRPPQFSGS
jgi:enoyl-CoA hydratase/carnithine racemase